MIRPHTPKEASSLFLTEQYFELRTLHFEDPSTQEADSESSRSQGSLQRARLEPVAWCNVEM